MIKIKMLSTGEVIEATRNVAFDYIDRKLAVLVRGKDDPRRSSEKGEGKIPEEKEVTTPTPSFYPHRQMRGGIGSFKNK